MQKKTKKILLTILQIIISFSLLYFVFRHINIKQTFHVFKNLNYFYLSLAFVFSVVFLQLLFVLRWNIILKFNNIDFSFAKLTKYHYISMSFQMVLPTGVGADAAKAVMLFHKADKVKSVNSAIIARVMGLVVLLFFSSIGVLFLHSEIIDKWKIWIIFSFISVVFIFLLLLNKKINLFIRKIKILGKIKFIKKFLDNFLDNMNIKMLFLLFFTSLLIQFVTITGLYFTFLSIGIHILFLKLMVFIPILLFLTIIIPSIAGIGTKEYFFWYFFSAELINKNVLAAFDIVHYSLILIVVFLGLIFMLYSIVKGKK